MRRNHWVKSSNKLLFGVCAGIAPQLGLSVRSLRVLWFCSAFMLGVGLIMYAICTLCLPNAANSEDQSLVTGLSIRLSRILHIEVGLVRCLWIILFLIDPLYTSVSYAFLFLALPFRAPELVIHRSREDESQSPSVF